jgi:hypothetical protein
MTDTSVFVERNQIMTKIASIALLGQKCLLLATVLFGIVALCGCDGDNGTGLDNDTSTVLADGSSPFGTDIDSYCNDTAAQTCSLCRDCYQIDYTACFEVRRDKCLESINNSLKDGMVLDKAAIDRCREVELDAFDGCEYPSADSAEYQQTLAICRGIFRETEPVQKLAENSECDSQIARQCANGLFCDTSIQPARCVPLLKLGSACEDGSQCLSLTCRQGLCIQITLQEFCETLVSE